MLHVNLNGNRCLVFLQAPAVLEGKRTAWLIDGKSGALLSEFYGPKDSDRGYAATAAASSRRTSARGTSTWTEPTRCEHRPPTDCGQQIRVRGAAEIRGVRVRRGVRAGIVSANVELRSEIRQMPSKPDIFAYQCR